MEKSHKISLKDLAKAARYVLPRALFTVAVIEFAVFFPPAVPAVIAAGVALSYVEYKRKNPKATFKHFTKSGLKRQRNEILLDLEKTDVGQLILLAKERIKTHKNSSQKDNLIKNVQSTEKENSAEVKPTMILSDKAKTAKRLEHIRWLNMNKNLEK